MKPLYLILILLFGVQSLAASKADLVKIDDNVQKQIESGAKLGVIVGLIENGTVTYRRYGKTSLVGGGSPTKDDIFEIGSVTKVFNGILLAVMQHQGRLDVNDSISKYYPNFDWSPGKALTLKQLATHTAGLPGIFAGKWQQRFDSRNPFQDFEEPDFFKALTELPTFKPVTTFSLDKQYSNVGAALLGTTLAKIESKTYEQTLLNEVILPMQLKDTMISLTSGQEKRFIEGHDLNLKKTPHWKFKAFAPAGALHSTPEDLVKFVQQNLDVYQPKSKIKDPLRSGLLFSHKTQVTGEKLDIGLFWLKDRKADVIFHRGGTYGFTSLVAFRPSDQLGLVVLSNSGYEGGKRVFVEGVEEVVFGQKLAE